MPKYRSITDASERKVFVVVRRISDRNEIRKVIGRRLELNEMRLRPPSSPEYATNYGDREMYGNRDLIGSFCASSF